MSAQPMRLCRANCVDLLAAGETTSVEVTQAFLDRIAAHDGQIGAFLRVDADRALAQAADVDRKRRRRASRSARSPACRSR